MTMIEICPKYAQILLAMLIDIWNLCQKEKQAVIIKLLIIYFIRANLLCNVTFKRQWNLTHKSIALEESKKLKYNLLLVLIILFAFQLY